MGDMLVKHNLHVQIALEAVACATQLDGLVVEEVNGNQDVHKFRANLTWVENLHIWVTARVMKVGNDSKTGDKRTT